jgi:hypothetical protein
MTDSQEEPNPSNDARFDELLTTIRSALAQDAGSDTRNAGAIACRTVLRVLDPTTRSTTGAPPSMFSTTGSGTTSPIVTAVSALRALLSQSGPSYRTAPVRVVDHAVEDTPAVISVPLTSPRNAKRSDRR